VRLRSRVYLHSLVVLLVVGAATSLVFALVGRGGTFRQIGERMARHVADLASERLHDSAALTGLVERLHADLDLGVSVRDLEGGVLARAGAAGPAPPADALAAARAGRVTTRARPAPYALAPVRDPTSGGVVATVQVLAPEHFGPPGLARPLLFVTVVLLAVAVASGPLARRLSRPLERLTEAARRLGGGDLAARVPERSGRRRWWRRRHGPAGEITELTRAFNEMAERVERLVRGQKELLANVSHELRSPLARLRMALALLPRDGASESRLADAERDLSELDRLIDDVLATARLEATGLPTRLGEMDVRALLTGLAERSRHDPAVAGKSVRVIDGPSLTVVADEALLRRAVWNLVDNAAKWSKSGGRIELTTAEGSLTVRDHGPGVPEADRAFIFERFYRSESARSQPGSGLGLAIVRQIAESHGGRIEVDEAPGGGARFRLTLLETADDTDTGIVPELAHPG
jgi:signal transduction histidine kinase